MSGRVLDENGAPVSGARVIVHTASGPPDNPPPHCPTNRFCWLATNANDLGEYALEFEPRPWPGRELSFVYSLREGYEVDVQWVPAGSPVVRNMRLHRTRIVRPGESIVVSLDASSSLCSDLEDLWATDSRCEVVAIESGAGVLNVVARPAADGPAPSIFWYTTGNYAGFITRPSPGAVDIPVRGGTYRVLVAVPDGSPSQRFTVTTTIRQ